MDKKQVAVIGLGRFGVSTTRTLYNLGHDVLAIDSDEERVQSVLGQATYAITADCTNENVLRDLGVTRPRDSYGLSPLAMCRKRKVILNPSLEEKLKTGDLVVIAAHDSSLESLDSISEDGNQMAESELGVT